MYSFGRVQSPGSRRNIGGSSSRLLKFEPLTTNALRISVGAGFFAFLLFFLVNSGSAMPLSLLAPDVRRVEPPACWVEIPLSVTETSLVRLIDPPASTEGSASEGVSVSASTSHPPVRSTT